MMIGRMLKKDFLRKKLITIVVFAFIFLSALLVASGANLMIELGNSLNALFSQSSIHRISCRCTLGCSRPS